MKSPQCWICLVALPLAALNAQSIGSSPPAATAPGPKEQVVQLSPFEVRVDSDTGYVGQNTLAGSRMSTNLKDLAAAISPMTAEFLQDIAATNIEQAMEYGMNARMETDDGRVAGPVASLYNDTPAREIRIRGLPGGSRTVNYFKRLGEVDTYNAQRLELSRGPNAILFGFGSPAGVVNAGTKQARMDRNAYETSVRFDSWKGFRATADVNVPILPDKLGLRAVVLHGEEGSWRSAGHNDQQRLYLTGTWRVDRRTTVKADFETGKLNRYVPRPFFGIDMSSAWVAAGQPMFQNFDLSLPPGTRGTPGNPFQDSGATQVNGVVDFGGGNYIVVSNIRPYATNYARFTRGEGPPAPPPTDFDRGRRNPKAALDANWAGMNLDLSNFSFTVQRTLWEGMYAEVGYTRQAFDGVNLNLNTWGELGPTADTNLFYPDGTPKPPGENLHFIHMEQSRNDRDQQLQQLRATLGYERSLGRLGRLRLAGLGEWSRERVRDLGKRQYWMNGPDPTSGGALDPDPLNVANRMHQYFYLPGLQVLDDPNFRLPGPMKLEGATPYRDPATGQTRNIYALWMNSQGVTSSWVNRDLSSYMGVAQFYTLKDRLVFTGGYRTDELKFYDAPSIRDPAATALGRIGQWIPQTPGKTPSKVASGDTFTLGAVFHVTPWFSLFYNRSTSVTVPSSGREYHVDPADLSPLSVAPGPEGQTQDYGLKLDLLDHRLFVTATHYRTDVVNDWGFSNFQVNSQVNNIWRTLKDSGALTAEEQKIADAGFEQVSGGYNLDSESKGYELEVVGRLTRGLSVSVNYSLTENKKTNIATRARAYVDHWKPLWLKYRDLARSQNASIAGPERLPFQDFNSAAVIAATGDFTANTDTVNETLVDLEDFFLDNSYQFTGKPIIGDNKHNLNVRVRYDFQSRPLKGLSIGGGMRVRQGRVAGAISEYEFKPGTSFTDAFNGRVLKNVRLIYAVDQAIFDAQIAYRRKLLRDRVAWSVQLNVNNLLDEDAFIINNTDATTGKPTTYRYQDPRLFILTNTFSF